MIILSNLERELGRRLQQARVLLSQLSSVPECSKAVGSFGEVDVREAGAGVLSVGDHLRMTRVTLVSEHSNQ